jgi:hypothetical protein
LRIDLDGIDQRVIALPIPNRNYHRFDRWQEPIVLLHPGTGPGATAPGFTMHKYDLEKRKFDKAIDGVTRFNFRPTAKRLCIVKGSANWVIRLDGRLWARRCRRARRAAPRHAESRRDGSLC